MNGYTFSFTIVLIIIIGSLIYLATLGSIAAVALLAVIATIILMALGAGVVLLVNHQAAERQQKAFEDNMAENLGIMQSLQNIQNAQNSQLLKQVKALPQAAPQANLSEVLMIEDGVFNELGD